MYLHRSNRAEVLVAKLAEVVATPVGGPLESETIVVQGKGMERWLTMELAKRHGVWANPDFPFARTVIERAFGAVLPEYADESWDSAALTWATARGLHALQGRSGFQPIRSYLDGDADHRKLLQLSERVAGLLDGYAIYRPEMLAQWQERGGSDWQAQLWQALSREHGFAHIGALEAPFMAAIAAGQGPIEGLPKRLNLFGISALPPLYVRVLAALATRIDVHLFLLSPSREYWADIRSRRDVLREELKENSAEEFEVGNEILATLGRLHRDFQFLLERDVDYVDLSEEYREPDEGTLLGLLQADILHLRDRDEGSGKLAVRDDDRSLTVHSCHGPTRELEVLRDQITARLDADPTLEARDIIVMTPDIESYAPFIDAVFSDRNGDADALPFHIADRAPRAAYPVVDAFARLLELIPGRLTGPGVLDVLSNDVVRERFAITADELPTIATWISESHIRWGSDAAHREAEGQPATDLNTWRFGLQRLLLGYASPSHEQTLFAGALAYDDVEGGIADLLGRFAEFCESLFALQTSLKRSNSVAAWQPLLERALATMIVSDDDRAPQHQLLRESFSQLRDYAVQYEFEEVISLAALVPLLDRTWQDQGTRSNFLSGGISFCQLMPMRSIPHRVVCIIGMNDGAFPKNVPDLSFDLVTSSPRLGDRRPRDDDRYLFLEAVLSARDALIITYSGQDNQTNAALPASVLVEQLIAIAEQSTEGHSILLRHPLQGFSPRYFNRESDDLFRYSAQDCQTAQTLMGARVPTASFIRNALPDPAQPDGDVRTVELRDFLAFFTQTSRYFLNQRVGLRLQSEQEELATREPLVLAGLEKWKVGDRLLATMLAGGEAEHTKDILRASGELPLGIGGTHHLESELPLIESIVEMAHPYRDQPALANLEVDVTVGSVRLVGQLDALWPTARQEVSYASLSGKRELRAWIQHLLLCHQRPDGYPQETIAIGREAQSATAIRLRCVETPEAILQDLVDLFEAGQSTPLPFFPQASRAYAKQWMASQNKDPGASPDEALAKARTAYLGSDFGKGPAPDIADPYVEQLFGDQDPIDPDYQPFAPRPSGYQDFATIAMKVFGPLLAHRERV